MLILDLSQVAIANLVEFLQFDKTAQFDEGLSRHMILKSLRSIRHRFQGHELVIACDSRTSWRRGIFSYYKANRKRDKEESTLDWKRIFDSISLIKNELREYFPYRVIEAPEAEADDIIGVLCHRFGEPLRGYNDIYIISGDKDFVQLQQYANVMQWNPTLKKFVTSEDPKRALFEHIIRGDSGDGVPNIFSDDDTLVTSGKRQRKVMSKLLTTWKPEKPADFCTNSDIALRYERNRQLIDLSYTPKSIVDIINESYDAQEGKSKDRSKLMNYFIKFQLKTLSQDIGDF